MFTIGATSFRVGQSLFTSLATWVGTAMAFNKASLLASSFLNKKEKRHAIHSAVG